MQRVLRYCFLFFMLCSLTIALGFFLFIGRILLGPIPLNFFTPYIQMALNQENSPYLFTLSNTTARWVKEKHALDLQVSARIKTRRGQTIAIFPSLSLFFRITSIKKSIFSPYALESVNSHLYLCRTPERLLALQSAVKEKKICPLQDIESMIGTIFSLPHHHQSSLERIRLTNSSITFDDQVLGLTWTATDINFEWTHDHDGIGIDGQVLVRTGNGLIPVMLAGHQRTYEQQLALTLTFANLRPTTLPLRQRTPAVDINLPIAGTLSARLDSNYQLHNVKFLITSSIGVLTVSSLSSTRYAVRSLTLQGTLSQNLHSLMLDRGALDLGKKNLSLVAYFARIPSRVSQKTNSYLDRYPDETSIVQRHVTQKERDRRPFPFFSFVWESGPMSFVPFLSSIPDHDHTLVAATEITLNRLSTDDLMRYWPDNIISGSRYWIATNVRDGTIEKMRFSAVFNGTSLAKWTAEHLHSGLTVRNVTIDPFEKIPPIQYTNAIITFHSNWLEVQLASGAVQDFYITDADMILTGLQQGQPFCTIEVVLMSSVDALLSFVQRSASLGESEVSPVVLKLVKYEGGIARARLALAFPVEKSLRLESITVKAQVQLSNIALTSVKQKYKISNGDITLTVDTHNMNLTGKAIIAGAFVRLEWEEFFKNHLTTHLPIRSRYIVHSCLDDTQREALLGDWVPFLIQPYVNGPIQTNLVASIGFDGLGTAVLETDLAATVLESTIAWHKISHQPGRVTMTMRFPISAIMLSAIPRFTLETDEVTLGGSLSFTRAGRLERLIIQYLQLGRTELSGILESTLTSGWILHMVGPALDLHPLLNTPSKYRRVPRKHNLTQIMPNLSLELRVARLWGSQQGVLTSATLKALQQGGIWRHCSLEALVSAQDTVNLSLVPIDDVVLPAQVLTATSENVGTVLQTLNLFSNMMGGRTRANAIFASGKTRGTIQVDDYRLVNTPLLARLLTMAALTGILESLTGDGIRFTQLKMSFVHYKSIFSIAHLHTAGPSLGLTATGKFYLKNRIHKICGTIVPIYFINNLIARIPSFGNLISSFKKYGLFAVTYTMSGSFTNPSIIVNPLVAVVPSFLRDLFMFCGDDSDHGKMLVFW